MKPPSAACLHFLPALLALVLTAGCESARTARIREHAGAYASLDSFSRKLVSDGLFNFGFSPEAVYMSMGKPNQVTTAETPEGTVETWVYKNFLYGSYARNTTFSAGGGVINLRAPRNVSAGGGNVPGISSSTAAQGQSSIADMPDAPRATLLLDLRNGRVIGARLEF